MWNIKKENVPILKMGRSGLSAPTFIGMAYFNLAIFASLSIARVQWQIRPGDSRSKTWVCRDEMDPPLSDSSWAHTFVCLNYLTVVVLATLVCKPTGMIHGISGLFQRGEWSSYRKLALCPSPYEPPMSSFAVFSTWVGPVFLYLPGLIGFWW